MPVLKSTAAVAAVVLMGSTPGLAVCMHAVWPMPSAMRMFLAHRFTAPALKRNRGDKVGWSHHSLPTASKSEICESSAQ